MDLDQRQVIVEGLVAYADGFLGLGESPSVVREKLLATWRLHGSPSGVFAEAVAAIAHFPQPPVEDVQTTERNRPVREMLGIKDATEQLTMMLAARELLESLAAEFG